MGTPAALWVPDSLRIGADATEDAERLRGHRAGGDRDE